MKAFKLVTCMVAFAGLCASADSANVVSTIDGGGRPTTSTHYAMTGSISGIGGVPGAMSPSVTLKPGYIGQLYEVTSLIVAVVPSAVSEGGNAQLSATAILDDASVLVVSGSRVSWSAPVYPIASIDASGLVTPASVYTNVTGAIGGYYLGASNSISLLVLDTDSDNFGLYANDGIPDLWQVQYFGADNPNGMAFADPDGDGRSNLQEFLAATDPTDSDSALRITAVKKEGDDMRVTWSCVGGHSYVLQSTKSAAMATYTTNFMDTSPVIAVPGEGDSTTNYLDAGAASAPVLPVPGGQITTSGTPSTVTCSATATRGLADSLGRAIPEGSLLMLGSFSISETLIQSNFFAGNLAAIMSAFTPYTNSFAVGDGTGSSASWNVSRSAAGFSGQKIYLLAINRPTLAAATHLGIFTAPAWVFPDDGNAISIDLQEATDFVVGTQGGPPTVTLPPEGQTYTFDDTARLSILPGRILFYRVRVIP